MKSFFVFFGCAVVICLGISCKNESEHNKEKSVDFDLDTISLSWEQMTIALIEKVHPSDSSIEYYVGPDLPLYKEGEYIKEELLKNRENLIRAVLPMLSCITDSMLVVETYGMIYQRIDIYGGGKVYMYQLDTRNHLPCHVTINPINVSEEIRLVEKGFYRCYEQGPINDVTCITLITLPREAPKLEILALTINDILH